jgi:hypothetical protein
LTPEAKLRLFIHDHARDNEANVLWWLKEALAAARFEDLVRDSSGREICNASYLCPHHKGRAE